MTGYSSNLLVKKLGIKEGDRMLLVNITDHYDELISDWPASISREELSGNGEIDFIHLFTQEMAELEVTFPKLKKN